ncbi:MAG: hypothetical protein V4619_02430 [Bacteroidota bacterium]
MLLLAGAVACVIAKCWWLNRITFDIDSMQQAIAPMQKHIKPNATVGFVSNLDSTNQYALYYSSKFILAPQKLLLKSDKDTLLAVQLKGRELLRLPQYKIIDSGSTADKLILLLTLNKP